MLVPFDTTSLTTTVGELEIKIETGRMANQADGSVLVQSGGTVVLVTAVTQTMEFDKGFFPLTCHYQEMSYASGRVPGNYFRREIGRPSDHETLVSRLIDRPIRPLFPKGFRDEVQIIATVLSADKKCNPDVLALTGASTALHISRIPFMGPIAAARVGYVNGDFVLYPTYKGLEEHSDLNLIIAASEDAVVMVEGGANFLAEDIVADAIAWGHENIKPLFDLQHKLREQVGTEKIEVVAPEIDAELAAKVEELAAAELGQALQVKAKMERKDAKKQVKTKVLETLAEAYPERETLKGEVDGILGDLEKSIVRQRIKSEGLRIDGRDLTTVRPLSIEAGLLPRTHGSAVFRRGETSAMAVATLGSSRDEQRYETLIGDKTKNFMLHYNFPPYCVGEARMLRGPSRREIGHGNLAERSLLPVMPSAEDFPFTVRVVSEIMDSNGSSSMASVCGGCMALMDAGVPIKEPVAGIAMGLCKVDEDYIILTDILGDEDALGDMDFKVAGTREGVTAVQMDIKIAGIPQDVLKRALHQARDARVHILDHMNECLETPRNHVSEHAPQYKTVTINPDKIRDVIGSGGKTIKAITAATEADIDIDDSGQISIFAPTSEAMKKAEEMILYYDQTAELGKNYVGKVIKLIDCGAIVEVLPGCEGLLHVSQMDVARVENPGDLLSVGQEVSVKVVEVQSNGRIRLSRKAWLLEEAGQEVNLDDYSAPRGGGRPGGRPSGGRPRGGGRR
jgi:polyribonucleotide nucleotidyltransferase